jgi:tetratricopeptide (TPR) repeat protein
MFQQARWYRHHVAQLIDRRRFTLREGRELYRCAGWLSIILGWLSHDLGDSRGGEAYCLDAWEHGWQAENNEICAWAMDASATIATYSNRPVAARDAAIRGLSRAPRNSAAGVRAACQLARAYARLGQRDRFQDALGDARRRFDVVPEVGSGLFSVDAARLASYAATSHIWLGQHGQALRHADEALTCYERADPGSPTREAIARLDRCLALVGLDAPDGAVREAIRALDGERMTSSVLARAGDLDAALQQRYRDYRGSTEFHERYVALADRLNRAVLTVP